MGRATVEGGPATLNLGPEGQPELGTTISEAPAFTAFYDYLRARHPEHDHRYDTIWDALRPTNANTAVVLSAWSEVVDDARSLARLLEVRDGKWSVPIITSLLVSQGKLNAAYEEIASRLQSLRNKVGGATEPPTDEVVDDFASTTRVVRAQLRKAEKSIRLAQARDQLPTDQSPHRPAGSGRESGTSEASSGCADDQ